MARQFWHAAEAQASPGEEHEHWPEQRPMTPADFDRPFVDEPTERFVEQGRGEPEGSRAAREDSQSSPKPNSEPTPDERSDEDKSSGERKRGWWKRVLS